MGAIESIYKLSATIVLFYFWPAHSYFILVSTDGIASFDVFWHVNEPLSSFKIDGVWNHTW